MNKLMTYEEVVNLINSDILLVLAGSFELLSSLPKGNWIGGTSAYFIDEAGGVKTNDKIFAVSMPSVFSNFNIVTYTEDNISLIADKYYEHGFTYLILPAFSKIHYSYAEKCRDFDNIYKQPLMGWVAGFDLEDKRAETGWVFDGKTGEFFTNKAVALHVSLLDGFDAKMETVNLFDQGNGDIFQFLKDGFIQKDCIIRGEVQNFYDYVVGNECDIQLPLVANYQGLQTNISIKYLDQEKKVVYFYAPIFSDQEYQFASPVGFYDDEFEEQVIGRNLNPDLSCNCILNYLYAQLEGKKTSNIKCPMTFGEISHLLINQTLVCLTFIKK